MNAPVTLAVLQILTDAGEPGMLASGISRRFDYPAEIMKRAARVNSVLMVQQRQGHVRRGGLERSPYYHGTPVYRWYITPEGVAYLTDGGWDASVRRSVQQRGLKAAGKRALTEHRAEIVREATRRAEQAEGCRALRSQIVVWAHGEGLTWAAIGKVFGITRERARQIAVEPQSGRPHPCPRHGRDCLWKPSSGSLGALYSEWAQEESA